MDKRNNVIDLFSGVFILVVIISHALMNCGLYTDSFFRWHIESYLFIFMPWFYFKAGMLYHPASSFSSLLHKQIVKLGYPYLVWNVICIIVTMPLYLYNEPISKALENIGLFLLFGNRGDVPANAVLWFLVSLFSVYMIVPLIKKNHLRWITVFAIMATLNSQLHFPWMPFCTKSLFLALFFFELGVYIGKTNITLKRVNLLMLTMVYIALVSIYPQLLNFRQGYMQHGVIPIMFVYSILAFVIIFNLTRYKLKCKPLEYIGRNSMVFYVSHIIPINVVKLHYQNYPPPVGCTGYEQLIFMVIGLFLIFAVQIFFMKHTKWLYKYD